MRIGTNGGGRCGGSYRSKMMDGNSWDVMSLCNCNAVTAGQWAKMKNATNREP